jgi:competence protein ComGC
MKRITNKLKTNKGITLVALVITIILLLILAGLTISSIVNNNMIQKTQEAKEKTEIAGYEERLAISKSTVALNNMGDVELDKFIDQVYEDKIVPDGNITKLDEEKAKVVTEEGYVFIITGEVIEYMGKGEEGENNADKWPRRWWKWRKYRKSRRSRTSNISRRKNNNRRSRMGCKYTYSKCNTK